MCMGKLQAMMLGATGWGPTECTCTLSGETDVTDPTMQVSADELYVVVNAGCRDKDLAHIGKHLDAYKVGRSSNYYALYGIHSQIICLMVPMSLFSVHLPCYN